MMPCRQHRRPHSNHLTFALTAHASSSLFCSCLARSGSIYCASSAETSESSSSSPSNERALFGGGGGGGGVDDALQERKERHRRLEELLLLLLLVDDDDDDASPAARRHGGGGSGSGVWLRRLNNGPSALAKSREEAGRGIAFFFFSKVKKEVFESLTSLESQMPFSCGSSFFFLRERREGDFELPLLDAARFERGAPTRRRRGG